LIHRLARNESDERASGESWDWSVSEATVDRDLSDGPSNLLEKGLVEEVSESESEENQYRITPAGEGILESFSRAAQLFDISSNDKIGPFIEIASNSEFEMDSTLLVALSQADIYSKNSFDLDLLFKKGIEYIERSDTVHGMTQVMSGDFIESFNHHLQKPEKEIELIITPRVRSVLREEYTDTWNSFVSHKDSSLFVYDGDIMFNWSILDHGVAWGFFNPGHELELLSDSPIIKEWAMNVYQKYRSESSPITEEEIQWAKKLSSNR
jgi:hypothetical protein